MTKNDARMVAEALRSAYREIEAIEEDSDFYSPSGRLMEQIEAAIELMEREYGV